MDFKNLKERFPKLDEIKEIVTTYEVFLLDTKKTLKIRIIKINDNHYTWENNLLVKRNDQPEPYHSSIRFKDSVEDALIGGLEEFFTFYDDEVQTIENKNW